MPDTAGPGDGAPELPQGYQRHQDGKDEHDQEPLAYRSRPQSLSDELAQRGHRVRERVPAGDGLQPGRHRFYREHGVAGEHQGHGQKVDYGHKRFMRADHRPQGDGDPGNPEAEQKYNRHDQEDARLYR